MPQWRLEMVHVLVNVVDDACIIIMQALDGKHPMLHVNAGVLLDSPQQRYDPAAGRGYATTNSASPARKT